MADGFTITLDIEGDLARQIDRASKAAGMSRQDFAQILLQQHLFDPSRYTWSDGDPRDPEIPQTAWEDARPWEEVEAEMRALVAKKLSERS